MAEYSYTPADLTVPANTKLTVINDGKLTHTYILRGIGRGTPDVQPRNRATLDLAGVAPGTYEVFCDQPGHTENGQLMPIVTAEALEAATEVLATSESMSTQTFEPKYASRVPHRLPHWVGPSRANGVDIAVESHVQPEGQLLEDP